MFDMGLWVLPITALIVLIVSTVVFLASRYKRCPSDMILVVYGKVGEGHLPVGPRKYKEGIKALVNEPGRFLGVYILTPPERLGAGKN